MCVMKLVVVCYETNYGISLPVERRLNKSALAVLYTTGHRAEIKSARFYQVRL